MAQNIPVKEAAKIMGKSQQFIRIGLQEGILPFGKAVKLSTQFTYYISPKQFYEYVDHMASVDGCKAPQRDAGYLICQIEKNLRLSMELLVELEEFISPEMDQGR